MQFPFSSCGLVQKDKLCLYDAKIKIWHCNGIRSELKWCMCRKVPWGLENPLESGVGRNTFIKPLPGKWTFSRGCNWLRISADFWGPGWFHLYVRWKEIRLPRKPSVMESCVAHAFRCGLRFGSAPSSHAHLRKDSTWKWAKLPYLGCKGNDPLLNVCHSSSCGPKGITLCLFLVCSNISF